MKTHPRKDPREDPFARNPLRFCEDPFVRILERQVKMLAYLIIRYSLREVAVVRYP